MPELPSNKIYWVNQVEAAKIKNKTIHSFESPASGSKINWRQFLLLRVLWVTNQATKLSSPSERGRWGVTEQNIQAARQHLKAMPGWTRYISTASKTLAWHRENNFSSLGAFSLVCLYQLNSNSINPSQGMFIHKLEFSPMKTRSQDLAGDAQVKGGNPVTPTRSQRKATASDDSRMVDKAIVGLKDLSIDDDNESSESPEDGFYLSPLSPPTGDFGPAFKSISDEQIVNIALLLYLQALLINFSGIRADWTSECRALVVKRDKDQKVYEARVDGFLRYQDDPDNPIIAIVEVKPFLRDIAPDLNPTRMQESAHMAAWISQHPPTPSELTSGGTFRCVISVCRRSLPL
ncbi:uncharacterized protein N7479_009754 [Penicillium vulpinum]|uniref:Uncharacterized protein n=1 Tax=Penicillium vulpinum TaxID=29845 RepID=A0A1V6RXU4_9EURO|nr:uncharacterized protein N7479_009754 [Penicillium vulpinum]KAJ5951341.1 hypothetical protein N7479_009754 [Penicillium vulpinum]OQE06587.1 hypothetical protein PENVUL_c017G04348 [Penicillium vulpinum]